MSDVPTADRRFPELVRYSYLEELLARRRVLVVGPLGAGSCERIAELGARRVVGVDADPGRIADLAAPGVARVEYRATSPAALDLPDGSFDVVVFPDLSAHDDPAGALAEARRVLTDEGLAVVALANREATRGLAGVEPPELGYAELYELCASVFPTVRMVGQSPFVGYSLADFTPSEEEPGITFDASLGPDEGEEVEFYLAICSDEPVEIDPYAIVQLPLDSVAPREVDGRAAGADLREDVERLREQSVERSIKAQRLEHELKAMEEEARKARDRAARFAKELDDEKKARQRAELEGAMVRRSPELGELRDRVAALTAEIDELRPRAAAAERASELEARLEALLAERTQAEEALEAQESRLRDQEQRLDECERSLTELATELEARGTQLHELEAKLAGSPPPSEHEALRARARLLEAEVLHLNAVIDQADAERGADVGRLETELEARARRVVSLEAEVARRESIVRDLCAQLEESARDLGESAEAAGTAGDPDALAQARAALERAAQRADDAEGRLAVAIGLEAERDARIAALEDERQACSWRISELEGQLRFSRPSAGLVDADVAAAMARGYRLRVAELESELAEALAQTEAVVADANTKSALAARLSAELEAVRNRTILVEGEADVAREAAGRYDAQAALAEKLEAELGAARNRTVLLESELEACRRRADDLEAERQKTLERLEEALGRFAASEADASFARQMAAVAQAEVLELRSILSIREGQIVESQRARADLKERVEELTRLRGESESERSQGTEARELEATRARDALGAELAAERGRSAAAERARDAITAELESARERSAAAEARAAELEAGIAALRAEADEGRRQAGRQDAEIHEALARADRLSAELEQLRVRADGLGTEIDDARRESGRVGAALEEARRETERLGQELEAERARLAEIGGRLDPLEAERREALVRAQTAEEREQEGAQAVRRLMEEIDAQRIRLREALERGDVLLAELQARQSDVVDARKQKELADGAAADLRRKLEATQGQLDELRSRSGALETEGRDARYRIEARERELEEVRGKLAMLESDFRAARTAAEDRAREVNATRQKLTEAERAAAAAAAPRDAEIARLREQIRGLERAAEDMAARAAAPPSDTDASAVTIARLGRELEEARRADGDALRADLARVSDELARVRDEASGHELLMRSLMAQVEERDGRILVLERRSAEESERAGAALRAAQEQIARMADEIEERSDFGASGRGFTPRERAGGAGGAGGPPGEIGAADSAAARARAATAGDGATDSRELLESLRRELMRLSEDGRAQPLWEEIRALLRQFPKGS